MTRTKYHAVVNYIEGKRFASLKEGRRYQELMLLQKNGDIRNLETQVKYTIIVNNAKICQYIADFRYIDCRFEKEVVEDTKGVKTPVYRLKKKLMLAVYGIDILET